MTATVQPLIDPAPPRLRLLAAPCCEPPYDDELPAAAPAAPSSRRLRVVPEPRSLSGSAGAPDPLPDALVDAADAGSVPPARQFAHAFVQRLLEVMAGLRPLTQLRRDTTVEVYAALEQVLAARPRAAGRRPTSRDVRSVHVQERPDGTAEVCATVVRGSRVRALALRMQLHSADGWQCSVLLGI